METKYKQFDIYQQRKSWNLNNSEKVSRQKHLILPITMHLISVLKKIMHAWLMTCFSSVVIIKVVKIDKMC